MCGDHAEQSEFSMLRFEMISFFFCANLIFTLNWMIGSLNFLPILVRVHSLPRKKKKEEKAFKHFGRIADNTRTKIKTFARSKASEGTSAVSRSATSNDDVVHTGATCNHSEQAGLKFYRPSRHASPQSIAQPPLGAPLYKSTLCVLHFKLCLRWMLWSTVQLGTP